jgi:hypothetical protein
MMTEQVVALLIAERDRLTRAIAGIFTVQDLLKRTQAQVVALHGIGRTSIPVLKEALMEASLRFTRE